MTSPAVRLNPQQTCGHSPPCGCEDISGCCVKCPLLVCVHEDPLMAQRVKNQRRDEAIEALKGKCKAREVARRYSLSVKTVWDIWRRRETSNA